MKPRSEAPSRPPSGGSITAIIGGAFRAIRDTGEACISFLQDGAWLNVHLDDADGGRVDVAEAPLMSRVPIYGKPWLSLPPVDGVFLLGSEAVDGYLRVHDWVRTEPYNDNFPDRIPGEYERLWQQDCPVYRSGITAVLGGWHFPWPDGHWPSLVDHELVVFTVRDAEPYVEVLGSDGSFDVKQRIS